MAYEYGCVVGFGEHEICATVGGLGDAKHQCELLQRDWDGKGVGKWEFDGREWRGQSDDPAEPWYVRETRE